MYTKVCICSSGEKTCNTISVNSVSNRAKNIAASYQILGDSLQGLQHMTRDRQLYACITRWRKLGS